MIADFFAEQMDFESTDQRPKDLWIDEESQREGEEELFQATYFLEGIVLMIVETQTSANFTNLLW